MECVDKVVSNYLQSEIIINGVRVLIEAGLARKQDNNAEEVFVLNCDYFNYGNFQTKSVLDVLNKLHMVSQMFFRRTITDKLHNAMEPMDFNNG